MRFDLRLPLGVLFLIFGVILLVQGFIAPDAVNVKSLGLNMNVRWGLVQILFGAIALTLALRARRKQS
jgi:hypothetical protein